MQAVYRQLGREDATLLAEVAGVSSCRYLRDAYGAVTNEVQNGVAIPRALDAYGRPASAGDAAYGYDAAGRLTSVSSGELTFDFGHLPGTDLPAGWSCGGFRRTVAYGEFRDLVAAVTNAFGGSPVSSVAYGYDAAGRRTSARRDPPGSPDAYGYDALSRLVSVDRTDGPAESFAYDGAGNRLASSLGDVGTAYGANALNQIVRVSSGGDAFGPRYDADGNPTRIRTATGDWTVEWDAESRPVRWTCGERTLLMAYDHLGRRVRLIEMAGGATNRVATFVYDGYGCIARTEGGVTDRFVRDPSTGRPLAMVADGRAYLYAHDANGSVAELVDAATGVVAARYAYAAFGATLASEGPLARRNPFRFSSEYADDETGLVYYNWRHYDPVHGVWLGRDPIGIDGGANLYAFCGNDPIGFFDSNGAFIYPIMHPSPFFQEGDYDVGKVPEVFDQFGSSAEPFHEEKWFERRYAGWLKEARRRFTEEINDAVDCSSQSINGSRIMGKSGRVAITPGAPGMIPWEYPSGGNESEFGDELQNNWSTVAVLGRFAIDYVTPVTIQYDGPCFKGKRTFSWETLMYVEDTLGVGKDEGWLGKYFSWAASLRRVKRASWKITGKGECKCCK